MKKPAKPVAKAKSAAAEAHRKLADKHRFKSQLHEAKANLLDVDSPPPSKGKGKLFIRGL